MRIDPDTISYLRRRVATCRYNLDRRYDIMSLLGIDSETFYQTFELRDPEQGWQRKSSRREYIGQLTDYDT